MKDKRLRADIPREDSSPLDYAIHRQDSDTIKMVQDALALGRVKLAFQPVVVAMDQRRIGFHEGLIRVLDETGRPIPARDFMGQVEQMETGREVDCASLALALHALRTTPALRLSVNMSARSIAYPKWTRTLGSALAQDTSLGERLILEISESSAMLLPEIVLAFMREWRQKGVSFAVDQFGKGAISIPRFADFQFDIMKIDGAYIRRIHDDADHQQITAALLGIAKQFDTLCVAEAVETIDEARYLAALGVDLLQGYAFGAPTVNLDQARGASRRSA